LRVGNAREGCAGMPHSAASGLGWNAAGQAIRAIAQFILGAVLARLLGPDAFGVVAVAWMTVSFCRLIDPGMGSTLVRLVDPSPHDIRFACTMQLAVSSVLAVVCAVAAGPIAGALGDEAAAPHLRWMALLLPLFAISQIGNALLELRMDFRTIQLANLVPYLVGYLAVGIPLALAGAGAWTLVVAALIQTALTTTWLYLATRHPIAPRVRHPRARAMLTFGAHTSGVSLAGFLGTILDQIAVSRTGTATDLGHYNRAGALLSAPTLALGNALGNWLYPMLVRMDARAKRRAFVAAATGLMVVAGVPFAMLAGASATSVAVVYGPGWQACAAIATPLALAMPGWLLAMLASPLLWSCNAASSDHLRQWIVTALLAAAMVAAVIAGAGPASIAWVAMAAVWLRALLLLDAARRVSGWRWRRLASSLSPAVLFAVAAFGCARWLEQLTQGWHWPAVAILAVLVACGCLLMVLSVWVTLRMGVAPEAARVLTGWTKRTAQH